jgi:Tfp pilus assembly protein PilF
MGYKNKDTKVSEIARELSVGTLLEGSVRKASNRVRITVQLIEALSDKHLWVENYDRDLEDIFAVQSEVAEKVASSLHLKLTEEGKKKIEKGGTSNMEAYTVYLKGQLKLDRWDRESLSSAINYFEQALHHDPNYALAYCKMAEAYSRLGFLEILKTKEAYQKAERYAKKALELDGSLAEAHVALSFSAAYNCDFAGRERELKRAIALNPNLAIAHRSLAFNYQFTLRRDEGLKEVEKALELDPLSVQTSGEAGTWYLYSGLYDKAIKHLKDAVELDPNNSFYLDNLGLAFIQKGSVEEGLAIVKRAFEMSGDLSSYGDLAWAYVKAQRPEEAKKLLDKLHPENNESVPPTAVAGIYAMLGEKDKAFEWLERAYDERSGYLAAIQVDFIFENLRDDVRYQAFIEKMGLKKAM